MGKRGDRFKLRALKQKESRATNGPVKAAARLRREQRMLEMLKVAKPPYGKVLRNFLAAELGISEAQITPEAAQKVLKSAKA